MDVSFIFGSLAAFFAAVVLLAVLAGIIREIALKREHVAGVRLVLTPGEGCDRRRLLACAYYIKERFFPQMVIEIAEGIDPDKREDRFDNIPQR